MRTNNLQSENMKVWKFKTLRRFLKIYEEIPLEFEDLNIIIVLFIIILRCTERVFNKMIRDEIVHAIVL